MTSDPCPLCKSPGTRVERLSHGWHYCDACGRAFTMDEFGSIHVAPFDELEHGTQGPARIGRRPMPAM